MFCHIEGFSFMIKLVILRRDRFWKNEDRLAFKKNPPSCWFSDVSRSWLNKSMMFTLYHKPFHFFVRNNFNQFLNYGGRYDKWQIYHWTLRCCLQNLCSAILKHCWSGWKQLLEILQLQWLLYNFDFSWWFFKRSPNSFKQTFQPSLCAA